MSDLTERAEALIAGLEGAVPLRLNEVTTPDEQIEVIGSIRQASGFPLLLPHPEAMSLLVARRDVFNYILGSYDIIRELIDENEALLAHPETKMVENV